METGSEGDLPEGVEYTGGAEAASYPYGDKPYDGTLHDFDFGKSLAPGALSEAGGMPLGETLETMRYYFTTPEVEGRPGEITTGLPPAVEDYLIEHPRPDLQQFADDPDQSGQV